jgi:hypothetical protein
VLNPEVTCHSDCFHLDHLFRPWWGCLELHVLLLGGQLFLELAQCCHLLLGGQLFLELAQCCHLLPGGQLFLELAQCCHLLPGAQLFLELEQYCHLECFHHGQRRHELLSEAWFLVLGIPQQGRGMKSEHMDKQENR